VKTLNHCHPLPIVSKNDKRRREFNSIYYVVITIDIDDCPMAEEILLINIFILAAQQLPQCHLWLCN
jgi:hypothetical protein